MHIILIWFLVYVVPAGTAWGITYFLTKKIGVEKYNLVVIHTLLISSIAMSQYAIHALGLSFPWTLNLVSVLVLVVAIIFSVFAIGSSGPWYVVSALIQEFTMLSIAVILLQDLSLTVVTLLISPIFVIVHFQSSKRWRARLLLLSLWGIAAIWLFTVTHNVYLNAAIHAIFGSFFISKSVLLFSKNKGALVAGWLR